MIIGTKTNTIIISPSGGPQGVKGPPGRQPLGGLGDFTIDNKLLIFCGDSTTEQAGGTGFGFDRFTTLHRRSAGRLRNIQGVINFGGSGFQLGGFVNNPAGPVPVIQKDTNAGVLQWDYYGHKPTGAITLATALLWREGKADKAVWTVCYGINDVILNNAVGGLPQQGITDFVSGLLRTVVQRILEKYPLDQVVLRIPNPMTARPFVPAAGFPSLAAYPTFGQDLAADQALVEKWNQGLRAAYLAVRNELPQTILWDSWQRVFGDSNTTLIARTELPFMGDLVHPWQTGYSALMDDFADLVAPTTGSTVAHRREAEQRSPDAPWLVYPKYLRSNDKYRLCIRAAGWVGIGSNYFDIAVGLTDFLSLIPPGKSIYVLIGDKAAQVFTSFSAVASGANTRLTAVAPSEAMQAAAGEVEIYVSTSVSPFSDAYLIRAVGAAKGRQVIPCKVSSAGTGYIDIQLAQIEGQPSSKYSDGLKSGIMYVGGASQTSVDLAPATDIRRTGATSGRTMRISMAGDWSALANTEAGIVIGWDRPLPVAAEAVTRLQQFVPHAQNARGFIYCPLRMQDGATFQIIRTEAAATVVTVEVIKVRPGARTSLGVATLAANAASVTLEPIPAQADILAGTLYEFVVTSATSQVTGLIGLSINPL